MMFNDDQCAVNESLMVLSLLKLRMYLCMHWSQSWSGVMSDGSVMMFSGRSLCRLSYPLSLPRLNFTKCQPRSCTCNGTNASERHKATQLLDMTERGCPFNAPRQRPISTRALPGESADISAKGPPARNKGQHQEQSEIIRSF